MAGGKGRVIITLPFIKERAGVVMTQTFLEAVLGYLLLSKNLNTKEIRA